mmetsp:Transcript_82186/g.172053  ORF Transcript_82186/g.172053 Transcript_82186/m.172053 type:complete len:289 (-) Transcript_82186:278-1144(-)|eukprot:CAMPEP_0206452566 /NCGR_PEP_ID=MMETSP0324_2-20121206/20025_1 /ASSEMBLY_ACC=CAM_ASM_000836 /TAXON_ID=2866 /ORGANISM="Crypthecodinium cohnii, Strain Seligo" /LENGTH=288 /DNA_ID=CAMNT_0053922687 /DNA_START=242 /DNA_END=1108 /DNA_ORIENTATION=+
MASGDGQCGEGSDHFLQVDMISEIKAAAPARAVAPAVEDIPIPGCAGSQTLVPWESPTTMASNSNPRSAAAPASGPPLPHAPPPPDGGGAPQEASEDEQVAVWMAKLMVLERMLWAAGRDSQVSTSQGPVNNGSVGHPELCPRPCLFFYQGKCVNGVDCNFCHFTHPKRPAHLDKRHRAILRELPIRECLSLVLPILKDRTVALSAGPQVSRELEEMYSEVESSRSETVSNHAASQWTTSTGPSDREGLDRIGIKTALRALSVRTLITTLRRSASGPGWGRTTGDDGD